MQSCKSDDGWESTKIWNWTKKICKEDTKFTKSWRYTLVTQIYRLVTDTLIKTRNVYVIIYPSVHVFVIISYFYYKLFCNENDFQELLS